MFFKRAWTLVASLIREATVVLITAILSYNTNEIPPLVFRLHLLIFVVCGILRLVGKSLVCWEVNKS